MKLPRLIASRSQKFHTLTRVAAFLFFSFSIVVAFVASAVAATPSISNVTTSNMLTNSVTIGWQTDIAADTQIEYGTTTAYGSSTTLNGALVTTHSQSITGLQTNQLYNYRVKSRDITGELAMSGNRTLITPLGTTTVGGSTDSSN